MNIQIFGKNKCFDTKKAERYFKERGVKYQRIDTVKFGMSKGELQSVVKAVGGIDKLVDEKNPDSRSEEHTSELQSLRRISYAVFCLKKKK